MNEAALKSIFPGISQACLDATLRASNSGSPAKLERVAGDAALATPQAKDGDSVRVLVRVTSVRKRLLDEDNLAEKFHVDCCRYAGLIRGDSAKEVRIETSQRKTGKGEEEHTLIELFL